MSKDYIELEYIEGTGTQYIETGISSNIKELKIDLMYQPTAGYTNDNSVITSSWTAYGYLLQIHDGYWKWHNGTGHELAAVDTTKFTRIVTSSTLVSIDDSYIYYYDSGPYEDYTLEILRNW